MLKHNNYWIVGTLVLGLFGAACGDVDTMSPQATEELPRLAGAQQAISGGDLDTQKGASVGFAIEAGMGFAICSGTLIAPNLVLTARHCVAQTPNQYVICGQSEFGPVYSADKIHVSTNPRLAAATSFVAAEKIEVPDAGSDMCGFDIALIHLAENIGGDLATPAEPRLDIPVERDELYTAIGYGHIGDAQQSGSGTRRILTGLETLCGGPDCINYRFGASEDSEWIGDDGTCQGDSGGGAFDSEGRVLGALSRGGPNCSDAVYSGVSAWSKWIRDNAIVAAEAGGYAQPTWVDTDEDGFHNDIDNCPDLANVDQLDTDADGVGDACDDDIDEDGVLNEEDNCPAVANPEQKDANGDGIGDVCEPDIDEDGVLNEEDNCPAVANPDQNDSDDNGLGDACDPDYVPGSGDSEEDSGCSTVSSTPPMSGLMHALGVLVLIGIGRLKRRPEPR